MESLTPNKFKMTPFIGIPSVPRQLHFGIEIPEFYTLPHTLFGALPNQFMSPPPHSEGVVSHDDLDSPFADVHVKRPMNSFMIWAQDRRPQISAQHPELHNSDVSRLLGKEWRELPLKERDAFKITQEELKHLHEKKFPGYK